MIDFWILVLYGSWEAGDSLKIMPRGVGTRPTIENLVLRTFVFRFLFRPWEANPPIPPHHRTDQINVVSHDQIAAKRAEYIVKGIP